MKQLVVVLPLVALVGQALGCLQFGATERQLRELGAISVPARLKPSVPFEPGAFSLFSFDRSAWSHGLQPARPGAARFCGMDAILARCGAHELYTDVRLGKSFIMLHPLGALPLAERYQHQRPPLRAASATGPAYSGSQKAGPANGCTTG